MAVRSVRSGRGNLIALGLSSLVVAALLSQQSAGRATPPSAARVATALREITEIRIAPTAEASVIGTVGKGSRFLVGDEVSGWFPIIREWVNEDGSRTDRDLGWVRRSDIAFVPDLVRPAVATASAPFAPFAIGAPPKLGNTDGGECTDGLFKVTWPSGVDDFKARLDTLFSATDRTIQDCASIAPAQKDQWAVFLARWREFAKEPAPLFGSASHWENACGYSRTLDGWRDVIASTDCKIIGPSTIRGYEVPESSLKALESLSTIAKWGTIGVGGAALFAAFYPEIRSALGAVRRVTRR